MKYRVIGRLVGGVVAQIIEADDEAVAAEKFADADWTPVVTSVTQAPDNLIPGFTSLAVTTVIQAADLQPYRSLTRRYKLRFEAVADIINLINAAQANLYPLSNITMLPNTTQTVNEVTFDADLPLHGIVQLCETVKDGHVMAETVALEPDYTGERRSPRT